jgi:hypothetical protein
MVNIQCGKANAINLGDGLHNTFVAILGMVYYWLSHIILDSY